MLTNEQLERWIKRLEDPNTPLATGGLWSLRDGKMCGCAISHLYLELTGLSMPKPGLDYEGKYSTDKVYSMAALHLGGHEKVEDVYKYFDGRTEGFTDWLRATIPVTN
jgi:hypothetical protein